MFEFICVDTRAEIGYARVEPAAVLEFHTFRKQRAITAFSEARGAQTQTAELLAMACAQLH